MRQGPAGPSRQRASCILAILLFAAAAGTGCARGPVAGPSAPAARPPVFPDDSWQYIEDPAAAGYCADRLERLTSSVRDLPTTALMVVVGGRVLHEYGDVRRVSYLASVRKSVLAMLFGKYVESGRIRLDRTLADLGIDDVQGLLPAEKNATVADLLAARSGVYHPASNEGDDLSDAPPRGSREPGAYFLYSNWDFNALGTIFEQETGQSVYDALERDLARPIGMQEFDRTTHRRTGDARRSRHLAYHMNFSTRDMARIGYVMLREGEWAGRQIVPREWARRIARVVTPVHAMNPPRYRSGPFGYGYLWWVWEGKWNTGAYEGAYTAIGAIGQFITVLPKVDMVVVHKTQPGTGTVSRRQYLDLVERVLRARCRV